MKRQNDKFISNNLYRHVRAEFERASKLIIEGNFVKLCDKIDQWINIFAFPSIAILFS